MASSVVSYLQSAISTRLSMPSRDANQPNFDRDLDKFHHLKVRPLLDLVDKLRGHLSGLAIKLPQIVVVGDQSSGKSSVLESLSDINLPRGQNITTRVPLILRLVNLTPDYDDSKGPPTPESLPAPYAIISADGIAEEKIMNIKDVGYKVESMTRKLAGTGVGVVDTPISLTVYRAFSPDLTLVDLPGITRNAVGDQPKDIYERIRRMILTYIEPEESIILNVMPSTVDFPTCECISLARSVDPQLKRSIAVVTKLDIAEKGISRKLNEAVEQLGLQLGIVCVKNRNNEENERGVTFEEARTNEIKFFQNHAELSNFLLETKQINMTLNNSSSFTSPSSSKDGSSNSGYKYVSGLPSVAGRVLIGTNQLAWLLATIQESHVRTLLPKVRTKLRELYSETRTALKSLPPHCSSGSEAKLRFDQLITNYTQRVSALCQGDHSIANGHKDLHLSARLMDIYINFQNEICHGASKFLTPSYASVVEGEMKENVGLSLPNFLSHQVLKGLMIKELLKMKKPIVKLINDSRSIHLSMLLQLCKQIFSPFPAMHIILQQQLNDFIEQCTTILTERIDELLTQEEDMFTINAYYTDTFNKLRSAVLEKVKQAGTSRSSVVSVQANDLTVQFDAASCTLPSLSTNHSAINASSVLEMQINCLVYCTLAQKRIADNLSLALRYHFTRSIYSSTIGGFLSSSLSPHPSSSSSSSSSSSLSSSLFPSCGLLSRLQREWQKVSEGEFLEFFKESSDIADKRTKLTNTFNKLEKALKAFDSV